MMTRNNEKQHQPPPQLHGALDWGLGGREGGREVHRELVPPSHPPRQSWSVWQMFPYQGCTPPQA